MNKKTLGLMPVYSVTAPTLSEATYKAWLACFKYGVRVLNVKHGLYGEDEPLGHDTTLIVVVKNPLGEPAVFTPGITNDLDSMEAYRLELVYGIHDHWVDQGFWAYTYHQRFGPQIEPMLARIENTWLEKGRITSRDFQLTTWQWETDTVIDDPPCLQIVHVRLLPTEKPFVYKLNLTVVFRSRDLGQAFWENAYGFIGLQKHLARLIGERLKKYGISIGIGAYVDISISNHLYGRDAVKRDLPGTLRRMQEFPWQRFAMDSSVLWPPETLLLTRHKISAQLYYEEKTRGTNNHSFGPSESMMKEFGIDWRNFPYPPEWDL